VQLTYFAATHTKSSELTLLFSSAAMRATSRCLCLLPPISHSQFQFVPRKAEGGDGTIDLAYSGPSHAIRGSFITSSEGIRRRANPIKSGFPCKIRVE
jgi:hypothetical protein